MRKDYGGDLNWNVQQARAGFAANVDVAAQADQDKWTVETKLSKKAKSMNAFVEGMSQSLMISYVSKLLLAIIREARAQKKLKMQKIPILGVKIFRAKTD